MGNSGGIYKMERKKNSKKDKTNCRIITERVLAADRLT
jgi:hypothetical protein